MARPVFLVLDLIFNTLGAGALDLLLYYGVGRLTSFALVPLCFLIRSSSGCCGYGCTGLSLTVGWWFVRIVSVVTQAMRASLLAPGWRDPPGVL